MPTLWIVLGPLGQSITAANNLGTQAALDLPAPCGPALQALGVVLGVPVWGFALLWAALAIAVTVRTARTGMPFWRAAGHTVVSQEVPEQPRRSAISSS